MPQYTANVKHSVQDAAEYLEKEIVSSSMSTELLEKYSLDAQDGGSCTIMVFEKYYMRNSSRISLTISIDDLAQNTRVCATASGGGEGALFRFDWGASDDFIDTIQNIIAAMQ